MKRILLFAFTIFASSLLHAQCPQSKVRIEVLTDSYAGETSWFLYDNAGNVILQSPATLNANTLYMDSICVATNACSRFKILDAYGDGICCAYGHGYYKVFLDNVLIKSDSSFGTQSSAYMGCPAGANCEMAIPIDTGTHTAPNRDYWYVYTATQPGQYTIETCNMNACSTKIWVYDYCANLNPDTTNLATIYYGFNNCAPNATISAFLQAGATYYIRIGDYAHSCGGPINWKFTYNGQITGCMNLNACNYNPFATIDSPAMCIFYPSPLCPTGPDLEVDSTELSTSIYFDTTVSTDVCTIREGCLNGYNTRERINFSTKISNIGLTDFTAGTPPANINTPSPIFEWDLCHGHWHFKDYAQYLLSDMNNNLIPIGYKNGFCVLDLTCTTGTGKFSCGNMGITAGCADIYSSGLPCQWVDVTDVADGNYKLILRASWIPRPDLYGKFETDYTNNWARACIHIYHDMNNQRHVDVVPNCQPYYDCMGVENGNSEKDCHGDCNGTRLTGDLNQDSLRDNVDVNSYMLASIYHSLTPVKCNDLNDDQMITVTDAALLFDCYKHGPNGIPMGHSHKPCLFPNKIKNPNQAADFSITNIDYVNQKVDILIKNPDSKILGYQLKLKGLHLIDVQNMIPGYNVNTNFRPSGEIIVLTNDELPMPKNLATTLCLRVGFDAIDSNQVCIDSVIAVVNEAYEEIVHNIVDSVCIPAIPTPNNVAGVNMKQVGHIVSPNPFTRTANVVMQNTGGSMYRAVIYDVLGREVRQYQPQNAEVLKVDKAELTPGLYYIEVYSEQWRFKEKLLVQ